MDMDREGMNKNQPQIGNEDQQIWWKNGESLEVADNNMYMRVLQTCSYLSFCRTMALEKHSFQVL